MENIIINILAFILLFTAFCLIVGLFSVLIHKVWSIYDDMQRRLDRFEVEIQKLKKGR